MKMLLLVTLAIMVSCGGKTEAAGTPASPKAVVAAPEPEVEPEPPKENPLERIQRMSSMDEAFAYASPLMEDTVDESSKGTFLFTFWAMKHMTLLDVRVGTDETSFQKARKDPEEELGKKLCVSGTVIQIQVQKTDWGKAYEGLMSTPNGNLYKFLAVRSTGDLVSMSKARLCGVFTGLYDYHNSGGGMGHALSLVGVFDLPENN